MRSKRKKKVRFVVCLFVALIFLKGSVGVCLAKCPTRMGSEFLQDEFLVIAHRGSAIKFPENTLPAFDQALNVDGANALHVDLSLTRDGKVVLWHDWDPDHPVSLLRQEGKEPLVKFKPLIPSKESKWRKKVSELTLAEFRDHYGYLDKTTHVKSNVQIPTFSNFVEWATGQKNLKAVFIRLQVPADESHLALAMLREIKKIIDGKKKAPRFQMIFMTPHDNVLKLVRSEYDEFSFAYDREIPAVGIINYHRFTTVPKAMQFKNGFAGIGLPIHDSSPVLSPWKIYQHVLTKDFSLRDDYQKRDSQYTKIISWNFNDEKKMWCLIQLGVNGIVTDKPKLLRKIALDLGKVLD